MCRIPSRQQAELCPSGPPRSRCRVRQAAHSRARALCTSPETVSFQERCGARALSCAAHPLNFHMGTGSPNAHPPPMLRYCAAGGWSHEVVAGFMMTRIAEVRHCGGCLEPLQAARCLPCVRVVWPKARLEYGVSLFDTRPCLCEVPKSFVDIGNVFLCHRHARMSPAKAF